MTKPYVSPSDRYREIRYEDSKSDGSSSYQFNEVASSSGKKKNAQKSSRSIMKRSLPPYEAGMSGKSSSNTSNNNAELKQMSRQDQFFCQFSKEDLLPE